MEFNPFSGYKRDDFLKSSLQDRFNKAWEMIIGQHSEKKAEQSSEKKVEQSSEKNIEQRLGIADYLTAGVPFLLIEGAGFLLNKLAPLYEKKPKDEPESKEKKIWRKTKRALFWLCCIGLTAVIIPAFIAKMSVAFVLTFIAIIFTPFVHGIVQLYNKFNKSNTDSVPEHSPLVTNLNHQSPSFSLSIVEAAKENEKYAVKSTSAAPGRVSQLGQFAQADANQQKIADSQLRLQPTQ